MTTSPTDTTPSALVSPVSSPAGRAAGVRWAAAAVIVTVVIAAVRVVANPRFYFADDTQLGSFGQWWQLGERLRSGGVPVLDPSAWQAGNYFAEGQWGLTNPLTWLIALAARASESPVLLVTVVKISFLAVFALGVYLLAREFGAAPRWAAAAAVLAPAAGFTVYMDAASWTTGLLNAAVLPWVWWALRRTVEHGRAPFAYVVASYLLITFGYVFGVLILVVLLVETLVRALIERDRARVVRALAASAWGALITVGVYLPGVLTAPVTERSRFWILNTGFLNADLSDLAASGAATATTTVGSWWGPVTDAPLVYIAWVLPFLPLVLPLTRAAIRRCIPLFVLGALMIAVVCGPSDVGPLRWPVRFMPYLVIAVVVVLAVAATTAARDRIGRRAIVASAVLLAVSTGFAFAATPSGWRGIALVAVIQAAVLAAFALLGRVRRPSARQPIAAGIVLGVSAALVVPQMIAFPATPLPNFGAPDSVARMSHVLADRPGGAIVVGDIYADGGADTSFDERLMGNLWYLSRAEMASVYTVLPFSTFAADLCSDLRGATCAEALETLWSTDETTGLPVADLMSLSTIVAMKATYPERPAAPEGWSVTDGGAFTWVAVRDEPTDSAGGVVHTGAGTDVEILSRDDTGVRFRVERIGEDPRVVLSRLAYPGYAAEGARLTDPVRGWLLTVDVSDASPGEVVTVSFRPPGFALVVAAYAVAGLLAVGWGVAWARARRRQRPAARPES